MSIAPLIVAGLAFLAIKKIGTLATLQALDLELAGFSIDLAGVHARMKATNMTDNALSLEELTGDVYLNDMLIGQLGAFTPVVVPARGNGLVELNVVINPAVVLLEIISIFRGATGKAITMTVKGHIIADSTDIPFTMIRKLV